MLFRLHFMALLYIILMVVSLASPFRCLFCLCIAMPGGGVLGAPPKKSVFLMIFVILAIYLMFSFAFCPGYLVLFSLVLCFWLPSCCLLGDYATCTSTKEVFCVCRVLVPARTPKSAFPLCTLLHTSLCSSDTSSSLLCSIIVLGFIY